MERVIPNVVETVSIKSMRVVTTCGNEKTAISGLSDVRVPYYKVVADIKLKNGKQKTDYTVTLQTEWHPGEDCYVFFQPEWQSSKVELIDAVTESFNWDDSYVQTMNGTN